jgi:predicted nucleic acid-binding Zn finger protein
MLDVRDVFHGHGRKGRDSFWWDIASSDKTKSYRVEEESSKWRCGCPHFQFRLRGRAPCKHISVVRAMLNYLSGTASPVEEGLVHEYVRGDERE